MTPPTNLLRFYLAVAICCTVGRIAPASDVLDVVPAEAPLVIVFRNPSDVCGRIEAFAKRIQNETTAWEGGKGTGLLKALHFELGIPRKSCRTDSPVFLVSTRGSIGGDSNVVGFQAKPDGPFKDVGHSARSIQVDGDDRYACRRDEFVVVGDRRKNLRSFMRLLGESAGEHSWTAQNRDQFENSDVFIHIYVPAWRGAVYPYLQLLSTLMTMGGAGSAASDADLAATRSAIDWIVEGAHTIVDQMEDITITGRFDGESFRVTHVSCFRRGGSVANYLKESKRTDSGLWTSLPDRPFIVAFGSNWHAPPDGDLMGRLSERMLSGKDVGTKMTPEQKKAFVEETRAFYSQLHGMNMMFTTPPGKLAPMEMYGSYAMDDPRKGIEHMRRVADTSCDVISSFLPCSGIALKFVRREGEGISYDEMKLDAAKLTGPARESLESVYGRVSCIRQAVVGERMVFSLSGCDEATFVSALKRGSAATTIGDRPQIHRLMKALPAEPNAIIVLDLGRVAAMVPELVRGQFGRVGVVLPESSGEPVPGPLAGWAWKMQDACFAGTAYISADDALRAIEQFHKLGDKIRKSRQAADGKENEASD